MTNQREFFKSLNQLLSDDGVVALHVHRDVRAVDSPSSSIHGMRAGRRHEMQNDIIQSMQEIGFQDIKEYEEVSWKTGRELVSSESRILSRFVYSYLFTVLQHNSGFPESRSYVVGFKSEHSSRNWYRNEAEVRNELRKRTIQAKPGYSPLKYFDGATMVSYSKTTNLRDNVDCSEIPQPSWCGLKDMMQDIAAGSAEDEPKRPVSLDGALKLDVNSSFMKDTTSMTASECNDTSCKWAESCIDCQFAFREAS